MVPAACLGSAYTLPSGDMASQSLFTLTADRYLRAHEIWACILGLSWSDLGQLGFLRFHFLLDYPSVLPSLGRRESIPQGSLQRLENATGRLWCRQCVLRCSHHSSSSVDDVALADDLKKESGCHCHVFFSVSLQSSLAPSVLWLSIRLE